MQWISSLSSKIFAYKKIPWHPFQKKKPCSHAFIGLLLNLAQISSTDKSCYVVCIQLININADFKVGGVFLCF